MIQNCYIDKSIARYKTIQYKDKSDTEYSSLSVLKINK